MIDLISERVGGQIVDFNDEFFAPAENLIKPHAPVANDEYTDRGKWMDGWETRRRREPGHDWVIVRLGIPGRIRKVTVDTSYFTGNVPEQFALEATGVDDPGRAKWVELIPRSELQGSSVAEFDVEDLHRVEMIRFNIYPDGGVARLRDEFAIYVIETGRTCVAALNRQTIPRVAEGLAAVLKTVASS